jgi:hypothetical protein
MMPNRCDKRVKFLVLVAVAGFTAQCQDNTLTPAERRAGFRLLFDGQTMRGWRDPATEDLSTGVNFFKPQRRRGRRGNAEETDLILLCVISAFSASLR